MQKRERLTFVSLPFLQGIEAVSGDDVGNTFRNHIHHTCVMGRVTQGVRIITHAGGESRIAEGELFFLNPGQVHGCTSGADGVHSYQLLSIEPGVLARVASQISETGPSGICFDGVRGTHAGIGREMGLFFAALSNPTAPDLDKESLLYSLLARVLLVFARTPPAVCRVGRQDAAMERVRRHIQAHHAEPLTLAVLADVACLSPFHLQRLFTRHLGISPHQYLTHQRIAEGKRSLLAGASIAEAAVASGFSDQSHFTHHFKAVVGTTPGRVIRGGSDAPRGTRGGGGGQGR